MPTRVHIVFVLLVLALCRSAYADYQGPNLKMPLPAGYRWNLTTAVNDPGDPFHQGSGYYSLDFGRLVKDNVNVTTDTGNRAEGGVVDVLAAAGGTVSEVVVSGCTLGTTDCSSIPATGTACKVVIAHGNGYTTEYLHFKLGSIIVSKDQAIKQGQVLGKMGNTGKTCGTHLHFQVRYNGNSSSTNAGLAGVALEGIPFTSYTVGQYYASTNGLSYSSTNNPVTCADQPTGGQSTNWVYSCNDQRTTFTANENVHGLIRINDVTLSYRTKVELWKGTVKQWEDVSGWNNVDPVWGWDHAFWWYFHHNVTLYGNLELRYFIDTENNANTDFLPVPFAKKAFTVNPPPSLYTYDGNAYNCGVEPTTAGQSSGWWYSCPARTVFSQGETVYGLVRIDNVYANYTFKVEAWKNGVFQWSWADIERAVDPVWGYDHAFFWPALYNAPAGTWQFKYFVNVGSGFGTTPFAERSFSVQ